MSRCLLVFSFSMQLIEQYEPGQGKRFWWSFSRCCADPTLTYYQPGRYGVHPVAVGAIDVGLWTSRHLAMYVSTWWWSYVCIYLMIYGAIVWSCLLWICRDFWLFFSAIFAAKNEPLDQKFWAILCRRQSHRHRPLNVTKWSPLCRR